MGSIRLPLLAIAATSAVAGFVSARAGLPVPWMVGPLVGNMLLMAAVRRWGGEPDGEPGDGKVRRSLHQWAVPEVARSLALVCIGLEVGASISHDTLAAAAGQLPALTLLVLWTGLLSVLNGFILARWGRIDRHTALLGCIPGAATSVVVLSAEIGGDYRAVAVLQYVRVLVVAMVSPVLLPQLAAFTGAVSGAGASGAGETLAAAATAGAGAVQGDLAGALARYAWLLAFGAGGVWLARAVHLPAGSFLGPCLTALAGSLVLGVQTPPPGPLFDGAVAVIGSWLGLQFDPQLLRRLGGAAVLAFVLVLLLMGATGLFAYLLSSVTSVSFLTAALGSMPGALEVLIAASVELGADTPLVAAMHMVRFLSMLFVAPWLAHRLHRRGGDDHLAHGRRPAEDVSQRRSFSGRTR